MGLDGGHSSAASSEGEAGNSTGGNGHSAAAEVGWTTSNGAVDAVVGSAERPAIDDELWGELTAGGSSVTACVTCGVAAEEGATGGAAEEGATGGAAEEGVTGGAAEAPAPQLA